MKKNLIITSGKRKTAVARAVTRKGKGIVTINGYPVEFHPVIILKEKIQEPLKLLGPRSEEVDIEVKVSGGGMTGQADASITGSTAGFDEQLLEKVNAHPSVLLASPRLNVSAAVLGTGAETAPLLTMSVIESGRVSATGLANG